jgi:hypothetical protein
MAKKRSQKLKGIRGIPIQSNAYFTSGSSPTLTTGALLDQMLPKQYNILCAAKGHFWRPNTFMKGYPFVVFHLFNSSTIITKDFTHYRDDQNEGYFSDERPFKPCFLLYFEDIFFSSQTKNIFMAQTLQWFRLLFERQTYDKLIITKVIKY